MVRFQVFCASLALILLTISPASGKECVPGNDFSPSLHIGGKNKDVIDFYFDGQRVYRDNFNYERRGIHGQYLEFAKVVCETYRVTENYDNPYIVDGKVKFKTGQKSYFKLRDIALIPNVAFAVRHGWEKDLIRFYGIVRDSTNTPIAINMFTMHLRDGSPSLRVYDNGGGFIMTYGKKRDLKLTFCFDGVSWTRSKHRVGGKCKYPIRNDFVAKDLNVASFSN